MYRCEEPIPAPPAHKSRLTRAKDVRAEQVGRDILFEPIGLRMRVPSHWQPEIATAPLVAVSPEDLAGVAPQLRYWADDPIYPLSARLLETLLPFEALLAFLAPEAYGTGSGSDGPGSHGFWGTIVMVFALEEPAPEVLAALEPALCSYAHAVSCPRDIEARYSPYRKPKPKDWLEWDFSMPWSRWRDVEATWLQIGAQAGWHAHGHERSNRVDVRVRRFEDVTLVVVYSATERPKIPVDPEALLPDRHRRDADAKAPVVDPEGRCILPPKGNIHWAVR